MNIETSLIYLEKNKEFYIRCEDKYNTLNSFIQHYQDLSHEIDNNSKHIVTIKDKVDSYYKAKDYVHSYNKELKDKYIKLLDGLIAVQLNEGNHVIEFKYKTPGLTAGISISIVTFIIVIIREVFKKYRFTKNNSLKIS